MKVSLMSGGIDCVHGNGMFAYARKGFFCLRLGREDIHVASQFL